MHPLSPVVPSANTEEVVYAKDQPEYQPLPCIRAADGTILTRWNLNEEERRQVAEQGYVYLSVMTFNQPLQPLLMTVDPPDGFLLSLVVDEWPTDIDSQ
jgi:hypothetical protein